MKVIALTLDDLRALSIDELNDLKLQYGSASGVAREFGLSVRSVQRIFKEAEMNAVPSTQTENYWRRRAERLQDEITKLLNWRELIRETIDEAAWTFKPLKHPTNGRKRKKDPHMALQLISDVHVGEQVELKDTGGVTEYNYDLFLKRCETFKEHFTKLVDDFTTTYPVPTLFIAFLGDIATSEGVFPLQLARNDLNLNSQIVEAAGHLAGIVQYTATLFPNVVVLCVNGNHKPKGITFNSDAMIYYIMGLLLRNQENVKFLMSDSEYAGIGIGPEQPYVPFGDVTEQTNIIFTHGHQVKWYMSVPYYSLDRLVMRYTEMTGIPWDYLFCGHGHKDAHSGAWHENGCWVGGTEYTVTKMQAAPRPGQRLMLFHPKHGITWSTQVFLSDKPRLTSKDEMGFYTPVTEVGGNA